jgi:hypothetical protein
MATVPEIAAGKGTSEASGSDDVVRGLWGVMHHPVAPTRE